MSETSKLIFWMALFVWNLYTVLKYEMNNVQKKHRNHQEIKMIDITRNRE